jgi:hypothetical protein
MGKEVKLHILRLEKLSCGHSLTDLWRVTFEFAAVKEMFHPFNNNRNMAGSDWAQRIMKRQAGVCSS